MSNPDEAFSKVLPAQLNFLSIYNPTLATSEENQPDQIVFYYSRAGTKKAQRKTKASDGDPKDSGSTRNEEQNEQLRQVGLARGMVEFARTFSNGQTVDSVETEKHRIVIQELEPNWWILASIDLTYIPNSKAASSKSAASSSCAEYSAREVSPPALLLRQLAQAHQIYLLHHGETLSQVFARLPRDRFCGILERFWTKFALNWDVMLHGNPSVEIYGGIKLTASGELGIGVGEEDWGSGEREVLEGLVRGTEGLVDLVLSRYGGPAEPNLQNNYAKVTSQLSNQSLGIGQAQEPGPDDGLVFSGLGSLSKSSLQNLTAWIKWIYMYGEDAYGVRESPSSTRRRRRREKSSGSANKINASYNDQENSKASKQEPLEAQSEATEAQDQTRSAIPRPIVSAAEESLKATSPSPDPRSRDSNPAASSTSKNNAENDAGSSQQWVKYLTLGYGSIWGPVSKTPDSEAADQKPRPKQNTVDTENAKPAGKSSQPIINPRESKQQDGPKPRPPDSKSANGGYFLIGLRGNLDAEDEYIFEDEDEEVEKHESDWNSRLVLRTLNLEILESPSSTQDASENEDIPSEPNRANGQFRRLRVVVYAHPPFIYTLLFEPTAASLLLPSFFHDLHHHLSPLHGPLLKSTAPSRVSNRLKSILSAAQSSVFDIVHSPQSLATRCSIPNIPPLATLASNTQTTVHADETGTSPLWTRAEALNIHSQILQTYTDTRRNAGERERTVKTNKGWWLVWMRVLTSTATADSAEEDTASTITLHGDEGDERQSTHSEAILVRKSADPIQSKASWLGVGYPSSSSSVRARRDGRASALGRLVGREAAESSSDSTTAPAGKLTDGLGLGVDPKKYIEVLLSLNR